MTRPLVLLHGAYHRPAHLRPLADALTGHGQIWIPDIGGLPLSQQTELVQDVVDGCETPPIVVAHSFAGAVAGGLTGLAGVVFLSAFVLTDSESATAVLATVDEAENAEFIGALRPSEDGTVFSLDPAAAQELFFNGCTPEASSLGTSLLRSELSANFSALPLGMSWAATPNVYVRLRDDRSWGPSLEPKMMQRTESVVEVVGGHSSFFCDPAPVARAIADFAAGL